MVFCRLSDDDQHFLRREFLLLILHTKLKIIFTKADFILNVTIFFYWDNLKLLVGGSPGSALTLS